MARLFLTGRTGDGSRQDPFKPNLPAVAFADPPQFNWRAWKIRHDITDEHVGYIVATDANVAPANSIDLGDPTDRAGMRNTLMTQNQANIIGGAMGVDPSKIVGKNTIKVVRQLNKRDPALRVRFRDFLVEVVNEDET